MTGLTGKRLFFKVHDLFLCRRLWKKRNASVIFPILKGTATRTRA
jgi:hypothetical protein